MNHINGFYWTPSRSRLHEEMQLLERMSTRAVYIPHHAIDKVRPADLRGLGIQLYVDFTLFSGESWWQEFPDSVPIDSSGNQLQQDDWYVPVCPNHPEVRSRNLEMISTLIQKHGEDVDGIWLDFIRYPVRWEVKQLLLQNTCFCKYCLNLFFNRQKQSYSKEETVESAKYIMENRSEEWSEWKCSRVTGFVKEARVLIADGNASMQLGMFALPWRENDYGGAIRTVAGQDLAAIAEYVDVISPMTYHKLCYQPVEWINDVITDVKRRTNKPVLPVVQSLDLPTPMSTSEFGNMLAHAMNARTDGVMVFTLEPLMNNVDKQRIVTSIFNREW